jgi:hypothetical protein
MLSVANGVAADREGVQEEREANSGTDSSPEAQTGVKRKRRPPVSRVAFPRRRSVKACHHCRTRRTKCDNERPSCGSCLKIGARCSYDGADHSTFDPASLAIIERLHDLEESVKQGFERLQSQPVHVQNNSTFSHLVDSPNHALLQHEGLYDTKNEPASRMSVEGILNWAIFEDLRPQLNLTKLLSPTKAASSPAQPTSSFHVGDEHELLQRFIDHVLRFNPILDEDVIRQYQRDMQYTGVRWDAPSCLLVRSPVQGVRS